MKKFLVIFMGAIMALVFLPSSAAYAAPIPIRDCVTVNAPFQPGTTTACAEFHYGTQSDGTGVKVNRIDIDIPSGCAKLDGSSSVVNQVAKSYNNGNVIDSQQMADMSTVSNCWRNYESISLTGPDTGDGTFKWFGRLKFAEGGYRDIFVLCVIRPNSTDYCSTGLQ